MSKGTGFEGRASSKDVEQNQLTCEWDSGQISRQAVHGGRTFLLPISSHNLPWVQAGKEREPFIVCN